MTTKRWGPGHSVGAPHRPFGNSGRSTDPVTPVGALVPLLHYPHMFLPLIGASILGPKKLKMDCLKSRTTHMRVKKIEKDPDAAD